MIKLRDYQIENSDKMVKRLLKYRIAYLAAEVRTGKTLTALNVCKILMNTQPVFNVLFVTKKKAIGSIEKDHDLLGAKFSMTVINYESLHKLDSPDRWDVIICDEFHCCGSFPKPSKRHKQLKLLFDKFTYLIALSGTPYPESKAQLFHQFNVSPNSPWSKFTFYQWAKTFCAIYQVNYGYGLVNKYDKVIDHMIDEDINKLIISFTQNQAGFENQVNDIILHCDMAPSTNNMIELMTKNKLIEGKNGVVLGDTAVKLQQKIHQLSSGTVKYEDGTSISFDYSKAKFISEYFKGKKIAIFYVFQEELNLLKKHFPNNTSSPEEFETSNKPFISQVRASREGVNLSCADALVYYNLEFSALSYIQGKDRMTSKDRTKPNNVYFIFSNGGIEEKIYKRVINKQDYSSAVFLKDYDVEFEKVQQLKFI